MAPIRLSRWQLTKLLLGQFWRDAGFFTRIMSVVLVATVSAMVLDRLIRPESLERLGIPVGGSSKGTKMDFQTVLEDCKSKYPKQPFLIRAFGVEYVVFPSSYFDEIKKLPEQQASALAFFRDSFHESWSGIPRQSAELLETVSVDLARTIPGYVRDRQADCAAACENVIGAPAGWEEVTLFAGMQEIVVSTNASAFVGRELGTSRSWTRSVERLPMAALIGTVLLGYLPIVLRPLFKPILFAPAMWLRWSMANMLTPILRDDIHEFEHSKDKKQLTGPKDKGKVPMTGWLLNRYKPGQATIERLINDYITLSFESTVSSAGALFFIIRELAADPALSDALRSELMSCAPSGELPLTYLTELRRMDSVMRESTRANPFSLRTSDPTFIARIFPGIGLLTYRLPPVVLCRELLTPLQLSTGPQLPAGTNICVDAHHINFSSSLWKDPEQFDSMRHYRKRQSPDNEQRFKFANLRSDSPGWGDGLQACPGRLFADNTLKIILTHLLLNYDFKLRPEDGEPKKGSAPNGTMYPDMWAKILFRSRPVD
ncbi:MAG: hypothetical protein Q9201_002416 [Fulgogasparrea decipioides]